MPLGISDRNSSIYSVSSQWRSVAFPRQWCTKQSPRSGCVANWTIIYSKRSFTKTFYKRGKGWQHWAPAIKFPCNLNLTTSITYKQRLIEWHVLSNINFMERTHCFNCSYIFYQSCLSAQFIWQIPIQTTDLNKQLKGGGALSCFQMPFAVPQYASHSSIVRRSSLKIMRIEAH